jgi:hypothetical protein
MSNVALAHDLGPHAKDMNVQRTRDGPPLTTRELELGPLNNPSTLLRCYSGSLFHVHQLLVDYVDLGTENFVARANM